MSDIDKFAEVFLGIKLTGFQKAFIKSVADGKTPMRFSRLTGINTANKVIREYLRAGIAETPPTNNNKEEK